MKSRNCLATSANFGFCRRSSSVRPCTRVAPRSTSRSGFRYAWKWRSPTLRERISTQPISMMRSPSLAFKPVVSVSRTTWRVIYWNALVRQRVGAFIFRVSCMSLHPMPLYLMLGRDGIEFAPQVVVLDGFLVRGFPALALPGMDPLGDALLDVDRIGVQAHAARALQRLERPDDGSELHAVVGGGRRAAPQLFFFSLEAQQRAPAAGPGVAAAGAVAVDLDDLFIHGGACARAGIPGRARAGAPAPCARPA